MEGAFYLTGRNGNALRKWLPPTGRRKPRLLVIGYFLRAKAGQGRCHLQSPWQTEML